MFRWNSAHSPFSSQRPVVVTGTDGQVGRALVELLQDKAIALPRSLLDLTNPTDALDVLHQYHKQYSLAAIINPAAYTAVDQAETDEETALTVNATTPGVMARWCAEQGIPFVHFSTDYVFAGDGNRPWREKDPVAPLNVYGRTKLRGERAIAQAGGRWLVFRTSWVYDAQGKNFVTTMLRLGREREMLRVVNDQFGAPTYAPQLAGASLVALEQALRQPDFPSDVYHLTHAGETNWRDFAETIFQGARQYCDNFAVKSVEGIPATAYPTPACRPANSRMNTKKARDILGVALPHWSEGLANCLMQWARLEQAK